MMNNRLLRLVFLLILLGMMPCQSIAPISTVTRTPHPRDDETSQDEDEEEEDDDEESLLTLLAAGGAAVAAVGGAAYFFQKVYKKSGPTNVRNPNVVVLPEGRRGASAGHSDGKNEDTEIKKRQRPRGKNQDTLETGAADQKKDEQPGADGRIEEKEFAQPKQTDRKISEEKKQNLPKLFSEMQRAAGTGNEGQEPGESEQPLQPGAAEQKDEDSGGKSGAAGQEGVDAGDDGRDSKELLKQKSLPTHDYKGNSGRTAAESIRGLDDDDEVEVSFVVKQQDRKASEKSKKRNSLAEEDDADGVAPKKSKNLTWENCSKNQQKIIALFEYPSVVKGKRISGMTRAIGVNIMNFINIPEENTRDVATFTKEVKYCQNSGATNNASGESLQKITAVWLKHSTLLHDIFFHPYWKMHDFKTRIKDVFECLVTKAVEKNIIDARDEKEQTALFFACSRPCTSFSDNSKYVIVKALIENKASVNSRNPPGDKEQCEQRPLQAALSHVGVTKSDLRIVQLLFEKGASLSLFCCSNNDPVVMHKKAIMFYTFPKEIFSTLDVHGNSPLCRMIASEQYSTQDIVQLLDKYQPDVNFPYDTKTDKLLCTAPVRHKNAHIQCVNKGSSLYTQSDKICYRSPLQCAIARGDKKLIAKLVAMEANILYGCCKDHDPVVCTKEDAKEEKNLVECLAECFYENKRFFREYTLAPTDKMTTFLHRMMSNAVAISSITKFLSLKVVDVNCPGSVQYKKCKWTPLQAALFYYMEHGIAPNTLKYYEDYIDCLIDYKADIHRTCCVQHNLVPLLQKDKIRLRPEGLNEESRHVFLKKTLEKVQNKYDQRNDFLGLSLSILVTPFSGDSEREITIDDPLSPGQKYVRNAFSKFSTNNRGSMWTKCVLPKNDTTSEHYLYYYSPNSYSEGNHCILELRKIDGSEDPVLTEIIEKSNKT